MKITNDNVMNLLNKKCPEGWIYIGEDDIGKERYALGELGKKNLICFGINPSTARPDELDPTIVRVKNIMGKLGCDGWIMLNMYPTRFTHPEELKGAFKEEVHLCNIDIVNAILDKFPDSPIWAAWGTSITKYKYLKNLLIDDYDKLSSRQWVCRGNISKDGHPHHPLYVANTEEFKSFDFENYVSILQKVKNKKRKK